MGMFLYRQINTVKGSDLKFLAVYSSTKMLAHHRNNSNWKVDMGCKIPPLDVIQPYMYEVWWFQNNPSRVMSSEWVFEIIKETFWWDQVDMMQRF